MADKSTAIPIGICEDVPFVVANVTVLMDFVILDIPDERTCSAPCLVLVIDDNL